MAKAFFASEPSEIRRACDLLAAGRGPIAIDTERSSGFRYGNRAFLVQCARAGSPSILIDPEGQREITTEALAPVINGQDWVLHAASTDLPSLAMLGLYPGSLFDTELAGRLAGFKRVNLAAMVERFCGHTLTKGHGSEDWSKRPLPSAWLHYAAEDVNHLLLLAEALDVVLEKLGRTAWIEQECAEIIKQHAHPPAAPEWRNLKGAGKLTSPEQRAVAARLHEVREGLGKDFDIAVTNILSHRILIDWAQRLPSSTQEMPEVSKPHKWLAHIQAALASDPTNWPEPSEAHKPWATKSSWRKADADSIDSLEDLQDKVYDLADGIGIASENLIRPKVLRKVAWGLIVEKRRNPAELMDEAGARPWQIELVAPVLYSAIHC